MGVVNVLFKNIYYTKFSVPCENNLSIMAIIIINLNIFISI